MAEKTYGLINTGCNICSQKMARVTAESGPLKSLETGSEATRGRLSSIGFFLEAVCVRLEETCKRGRQTGRKASRSGTLAPRHSGSSFWLEPESQSTQTALLSLSPSSNLVSVKMMRADNPDDGLGSSAPPQIEQFIAHTKAPTALPVVPRWHHPVPLATMGSHRRTPLPLHAPYHLLPGVVHCLLCSLHLPPQPVFGVFDAQVRPVVRAGSRRTGLSKRANLVYPPQPQQRNRVAEEEV